MAAKRATLSHGKHLTPDLPSPVAWTSKDRSPPQGRGYHPPYKVRRPDRHALLKTTKHGCNDNDNDNMLPDSVDEIRGEIASVLQLPSQAKSTTRTRSYHQLKILNKDADIRIIPITIILPIFSVKKL